MTFNFGIPCICIHICINITLIEIHIDVEMTQTQIKTSSNWNKFLRNNNTYRLILHKKELMIKIVRLTQTNVIASFPFTHYRTPNNPQPLVVSSKNPPILSKMTQPTLLNTTSTEISIQRPRREWKLCSDSWLDSLRGSCYSAE